MPQEVVVPVITVSVWNSETRKGLHNLAALIPIPYEVSACHPKIGQCKEPDELGRVPGQVFATHVGEAELHLMTCYSYNVTESCYKSTLQCYGKVK